MLNKKMVFKENFKMFVIILLLFFSFIIINAFSYVNAVSNDLSNSILRLHVIANSNSDEDQNLKYIVRDAVISYINTISCNCTSKDELIKNINLNEINAVAQDTVYNNGYTYTTTVELGNFDFPTKQYGDISLPAGMYDAIRIKIGNANGQNWWCVMFPPLCFVDISTGIVPEESKETLKENLNDEEYLLISDDSSTIHFKFMLFELFYSVGESIASIL